MAISVEQFIGRLSESGLLSAADVSEFQGNLPPDKRPRDVQALAASLVKAGKLTKYQAQAVYQGKTKGLAFGQYVVLDKLGEGGMGVVLKAQHRRMGRLVAIKVLSPSAMKQAGAVDRFHREAQAAAKLSHPNIVAAYDADEYQGMHYLAMEYVEGRDLATIVKNSGPLGVREAVECVLQAARGLHYAHEQGIVHRDIKPGNLLLDKKGTIKILDMGLARIAGADAALGGPERLTASGQVMGTCDYMAPEQALDSHTVDARADIYALGCTLYRLLIGRPPYGGDSLMQILMAHQQAPIPSIPQARPEVPPALDAVFQRMAAKKPEDRQQSMAEVIAELEAILGASPGRSVAGAPEEPSSAALVQSLAFLQENTPSGPPTKQKKPTAERRTPPCVGPEHGTGSNVLGMASEAVAKLRRRPLVLAGIAGGLVLLLGIVLTLALRHGTLVVEIDEELGRDVQVAVSQGGQKVQLLDAKSGWTLSLSAGKYDLAVEGGDDQFLLDSHTITVTHGGQVKVKVTLKPPVLAVAPFDAKQARKHQEAWARHLGVPVETTNSIGMKLVLIPPGEFTMGEGGDAHKVRITRPFYLGKYEVTQEEWEALMVGNNPSQFKGPRNPVESVSWEDCQAFLKKLGQKCGAAEGSYRLPTEAQWEHACRAGSPGGWCFGDSESQLADYAWYRENSNGTTHPVGQKKPNAWGLFDMHGNAHEWCADWYDRNYYKVSPEVDPPGSSSGPIRVTRGGRWECPAGCCRSARCSHGPGLKGTGFRVCLIVPDAAAERAKLSRTSDAVQPAAVSPTKKPSPAPPIPNPQSPIPLPAAGSLIGADGQWKLPPGAPPPAVAPFDAAKAKEHQEGWAKHLGVPVEVANSIGMRLVLIPPGEFMMGSPQEMIEEELKAHAGDEWWTQPHPGEGPPHRVRITRPFYLGIYLVTQQEYQRVTGNNPSEFSATGKHKDQVAGQETKQFPVECVSWHEAVEFCRKLADLPEEKAAGRTYLLPSEAQWEYACRAGNMGRYGFSSARNSIPWEYEEKALVDYGWFNGNADGMPHAVGLKRASAWGLYDMHGNVWERCQDWYDKDYYAKSPTDDPGGPPGGSDRVNRGGGWYSPAGGCRSARRRVDGPEDRRNILGFRVCLVLPDGAAGRAKLSSTTVAAQPSGGPAAKPKEEAPETVADHGPIAKSPPFWLGYDLGDEPDRAIPEVASYTNLVFDWYWPKHGDRRIVAAQRLGLKVVLGVGDQKEMDEILGQHLGLVLRHRHTVLAVLSVCPDITMKATEIAAFGQRLKKAIPGIEYWVCLLANKQQSLAYPLPEEMDVLALDCLGLDQPASVRSWAQEWFPKWQAKAGKRPLVAFWDSWTADGPGLIPQCRPNTLGTFAEVARQHGLTGVVFSTYGRDKGRVEGIGTRPELVAEIKKFGQKWGIKAVSEKVRSEAAPSDLPATSPQPAFQKTSPLYGPGAPAPAIAPFDATKAKDHQERWAKHLGVPVKVTNSIGMKLVLIPPGEFEMGSPKELIEEELKTHGGDKGYKEVLPDETPQHRVRITRPFYFGVYVVTQQEYQRVMGTNPSEFSATGKGKDKVAGQDTTRFPVETVSWDGAVQFCRKLSEMPEERVAGRTYRLPSEAQWEYACRAGNMGLYSFSLGGNAIPKEDGEKVFSDHGWFKGNSGAMPHPVGLKRASAWGLYDMHGNVWEWCQDWYEKEYYGKSPADDPMGPTTGPARMIRGGSWAYAARFSRSASRNSLFPWLPSCNLVGFRVCSVLPDK
jgi:serine/threonine-protein kinase